MKTKIIFILLVTLFAFSCKKEENSYVIPPEKRYLASVTDQDGKTVLEVEYYDDRKFKKFIFSGTEYRYIYDDKGRVSSCFIGSGEVKYSYNAQGRIVSYAFAGKTYPVTYNAAENSYKFSWTSVDPVTLFLDGAGNCAKAINGATTANYFYENKNGPIKNGGNMSLANYIGYFPMFIASQMYLNICATSMDGCIAGDGGASTSISYNNEYDNENFLLRSVATTIYRDQSGKLGTTVATYTYHYIEL